MKKDLQGHKNLEALLPYVTKKADQPNEYFLGGFRAQSDYLDFVTVGTVGFISEKLQAAAGLIEGNLRKIDGS